MAKNPTSWQAPSGVGYFSSSNDGDLTTLSGNALLTLSGNNLIVDAETYQPKSDTLWTASTKDQTGWYPTSGQGYVETVGTEDLTDNHGNFLTDNLGNNIVTTPTYDIGKSATLWTAD